MPLFVPPPLRWQMFSDVHIKSCSSALTFFSFPAIIKLASHEVYFIFNHTQTEKIYLPPYVSRKERIENENKSQRPAHCRRPDPTATRRRGPCFRQNHYFHRKGTIQTIPDAGLPNGTVIPHYHRRPVLSGRKQEKGGRRI